MAYIDTLKGTAKEEIMDFQQQVRNLIESYYNTTVPEDVWIKLRDRTQRLMVGVIHIAGYELFPDRFEEGNPLTPYNRH